MIWARAWSEFMNQNTLKSSTNPGPNGLFCCSDWRACEDIFFIEDETPDDNGTIMFIFH